MAALNKKSPRNIEVLMEKSKIYIMRKSRFEWENPGWLGNEKATLTDPKVF